jgi:sugar lactone lactonase YvrE
VAIPAKAELGEGPVWDGGTGTLYWVDILVGRVHRLWPGRQQDLSADMGTVVSAVGLRASGGLVMAIRDGIALADAEAVRSALVESEPTEGVWRCASSAVPLRWERYPVVHVDVEKVRFNDALVDPEGRFLAGTMHWHETAPVGALYQVGPDSAVVELLSGVTESNGIDITDDGRTLYHIDSGSGSVAAFDRDPETGALQNRRLVVEFTSPEIAPDGMTLDAEGCLWVALWGAGEVRRYTPAGQLVESVSVPARQVTNVAFGGASLGELFITTARIGLGPVDLAAEPHAGDVFWCEASTTGRLPWQYAG